MISWLPFSRGMVVQALPGSMAMCHPVGNLSISGSSEALHFLRIRLRTTALPVLLETQKAILLSVLARGRTMIAVFFP
ncbi:MAG: hypothetical protein RH862_01075 [Leptospiraceae bacterium]